LVVDANKKQKGHTESSQQKNVFCFFKCPGGVEVKTKWPSDVRLQEKILQSFKPKKRLKTDKL